MPRDRIRYPERLLPSKEIRDAWKRRGDMLEDKGYDARWLKFWKRVLDELRAQGTWDDRDVPVLAEYVEWCRLAESHQLEAEENPYRTHAESGRVFAHPGFTLARDARREARELGLTLGLGPDGRALAGVEPQKGGGTGGGDDGQEGDQTGL